MPLKMMDKQKFLSKTEDDTMGDLTIRPINTGYVTMIPKQYLYHHSTVKFYPNASDQEEEYPVFAYLVEGGDKLLLIDVFSAGEMPIPGVTSKMLADTVRAKHPGKEVVYCSSRLELRLVIRLRILISLFLRISTGIIASIWRSSQTRNSM